MKISNKAKNQIKVSFEQIVEKCETVGDLVKLDKKVREMNEIK